MVIVTTEALRSRNDGREIVSLTILRAFAAWWVVIYHFKRMSPFTDGLDVFALRSGWIGVDVFFVLSGFVLAYVYGPEIESQNFEFWQFLVKRFARIYPAHLFTLALMLAMIAATVIIHARTSLASELSPDPSSNYDPMRTVLAQLLLIHAWGIDKIGHFNAPSWSISAEWFAYLIFPVIAPALLRLSPRRALAVGLAAAGRVLDLQRDCACMARSPERPARHHPYRSGILPRHCRLHAIPARPRVAGDCHRIGLGDRLRALLAIPSRRRTLDDRPPGVLPGAFGQPARCQPVKR
jgi:hypothetical protein